MNMKKQIEEIIRDIEIEPAWNTGFSGCSERLNDKSVENAIDKIIQIKNLSECSEPPHPLLGEVNQATYIIVSIACNDCGGEIAVKKLNHNPDQSQINELEMSIGEMYCIRSHVFDLSEDDTATVKPD